MAAGGTITLNSGGKKAIVTNTKGDIKFDGQSFTNFGSLTSKTRSSSGGGFGQFTQADTLLASSKLSVIVCKDYKDYLFNMIPRFKINFKLGL